MYIPDGEMPGFMLIEQPTQVMAAPVMFDRHKPANIGWPDRLQPVTGVKDDQYDPEWSNPGSCSLHEGSYELAIISLQIYEPLCILLPGYSYQRWKDPEILKLYFNAIPYQFWQ